MRIVGLAGSDLLRVFILGAFRTVAEENFKRFHVSVYLCVCVRLGVPDAVKQWGLCFCWVWPNNS